MSSFDREKLSLLIDRVLEGCASPEDIRAIEEGARSADAQRFLAEYLLLAGELHWLAIDDDLKDREILARVSLPEGTSDHGDRDLIARTAGSGPWLGGQFRKMGLLVIAVTAVLLIGLISIWLRTGARLPSQGQFSTPVIAQLEKVYPEDSKKIGATIRPGDWVIVREGAAQWQIRGGGSLIAQGSTRFRLLENGQVELESGTIFLRTKESGHLAGVITPQARYLDRGTAFGVLCDMTRSEVHVLEGEVEVIARRLGLEGSRRVVAGEALACDGRGRTEPIPCRAERFCQMVPEALTVAAYRLMALSDPRLWLYGAFESPRFDGKWHAVLGPTDFQPVWMRGTMSRLDVQQISGYDSQSRAVKLIRGTYSGDTVGVGLQTIDPVVLPRAMTVEMIVRFDGWPSAGENTLACLLATRQDQRRCAVWLGVVPVERESRHLGRLVHLCDGMAPWTETKGTLVPGHWYYVAATFEPERDATRVSTWLADLTEKEPLVCVLKDGQLAGRPVDGYLGIGKGFDDGMSHAYPFPGAIDELAIYNGVLEEDLIRFHLTHLIGTKGQESVLPLPGGP
ncbi:MAG: FecR domain-containing protein [Thermogutta sp.]